MSIWTGAFLVVWMIGIDQHWPDATSPITFAIFIYYVVQDIVDRRA